MDIKFSKKYQNLFKLLNNKYPEVDTIVITGGRSSAKSFVVAIFSLIGLVEYAWDILYTRFTNVSITDSVKPEVDGKIELLNYQNKVISTNTHIEYKGNRIAFKGIKTGSKQQTANLKSLSGFNVFVVDEAEELPDYETFEKVFLSIRSNKKRNLTILLLNPASIHHWIYKYFFIGKKIKAGFNGVKDNVMYIHTSYLDVPQEYIADNIKAYYSNLKVTNEKKYKEVVMGGWLDSKENRIYKGFGVVTKEFYDGLPFPEYYGMDFGSTNPSSVVGVKYNGDNEFYSHEYLYKPISQMTGTLAENLLAAGVRKDLPLICDSADPTRISELIVSGFNAIPASKGSGSVNQGIDFVNSMKNFYTDVSLNYEHEYENYEWEVVNGVNLDRPIKKDDHILDADRYVKTYLQFYLGINQLLQK